MSKRTFLALASITVALAAGALACEDDTTHPLPLDAGLTVIDAAPPEPVVDAAADASDAGADAAPADAGTPDAPDADASADAPPG